MTEITNTTRLRHICEACGKEEVLTVDEGYKAGWDYPPAMGVFGIVSPRTCGDCGVDKTLWWRIVTKKVKASDLTKEDMDLMERIQDEPSSISLGEDG